MPPADVFLDCVFTNNTAGSNGGGIFADFLQEYSTLKNVDFRKSYFFFLLNFMSFMCYFLILSFCAYFSHFFNFFFFTEDAESMVVSHCAFDSNSAHEGGGIFLSNVFFFLLLLLLFCFAFVFLFFVFFFFFFLILFLILIFFFQANLTFHVNNTLFENNNAVEYGGGIFVSGACLDILFYFYLFFIFIFLLFIYFLFCFVFIIVFLKVINPFPSVSLVETSNFTNNNANEAGFFLLFFLFVYYSFLPSSSFPLLSFFDRSGCCAL